MMLNIILPACKLNNIDFTSFISIQKKKIERKGGARFLAIRIYWDRTFLSNYLVLIIANGKLRATATVSKNVTVCLLLIYLLFWRRWRVKHKLILIFFPQYFMLLPHPTILK